MSELASNSEHHQYGAEPGGVVRTKWPRLLIVSVKLLTNPLWVDVGIVGLGVFEEDFDQETCNFRRWKSHGRASNIGKFGLKPRSFV